MSLNTSPPPAFGVLIIGDEILSGRREDKHLVQVIALLKARGLQLSYAQYVGDDPARITAALKQAFESGDVVFSTGGIGATPDDHTRQSAAMALDTELEMHPQARDLILERMREMAAKQGKTYDPETPDHIHRLNMAVFPAGAQIIPNPYNKIAGFSCRGRGHGAVHFVPGFPVMAWPMIEWVLDNYYAHWFHLASTKERALIIRRAMEASLTPLMLEIEARYPSIKVFSLPSVDHPVHGRHIELGIKGPADIVDESFEFMRKGLIDLGQDIGPELTAPTDRT